MPRRSNQNLVEREAELAQLTAALADAASGEGRLVVLEAAAGLGKTRLVEAALAEASDRGMAALSARATELERDFAFGVVRQLIEPRLQVASDEEREAFFDGAAGLARPLFEQIPGAATVHTDPTYATLHGLYWLIANLAGERPLVLAVDDAQWADAASLRFLAFLLPRLAELPVALIVALRSAEAGTEREELTRLFASPTALVLTPRPLSQAAVSQLVEELLGEAPEPEFAAACHKASAGNPFYLHELLRESRAQGVEPRTAHAEAVAHFGPRAIARAVLLRLAALEPQAPALTRALAVLGDGAGLCETASLAGIKDEQRGGELCDLLVRAGILRRSERLEFVHPIVRQAVYADLAPHERAAQHARAARALADADVQPERVAAQLVEASPEGDPWVVEQLVEAAREAVAKGAPEAAERYLRRALEEPPDAEMRARALLELGTAGAAAGRPDADERLQEAFESTSEPDVLATAAFELGRALLYFGRPVEAVRILQRALDRLAEADSALRDRLEALLLMQVHTNVAARELVVGRLQEVTAAVELSGEGPPELLATVALEKARSSGPADQAAELAVRALEDGYLVDELAGESPALYFATCALTLTDRGEAAESHFDRAIAVARRHGSVRGFAFASCFRGWTRYRRGNLPGAAADLEAFVALAAEFSLDVVYPFGLGALVATRLDGGERDAADAVLQGVDRRRWDPESVLFQELRAAMARLHLSDRRPSEALEEALAIASWERSYGGEPEHGAWTHWRALAARAHAALGERDEAAALARESVALARAFGCKDHLGICLLSAAAVTTEAAPLQLLRQAVRTLERSQARLEHARSLIELGAALRRANRRSEAREQLSIGLELAQRCGARALAERAGEELEATGARLRRFVRSGIDALTPSERRIAQRAAEGHSNREIAQSLFVTQKTVEMHLSNAYRKLGVRSRGELPEKLRSARETEEAEQEELNEGARRVQL